MRVNTNQPNPSEHIFPVQLVVGIRKQNPLGLNMEKYSWGMTDQGSGNHPVAHRVIIIKKLGWVRHETDSLTLYTNRLSDRPMSLLPQKLVAQLRSGLFTFYTTTALNVL